LVEDFKVRRGEYYALPTWAGASVKLNEW